MNTGETQTKQVRSADETPGYSELPHERIGCVRLSLSLTSILCVGLSSFVLLLSNPRMSVVDSFGGVRAPVNSAFLNSPFSLIIALIVTAALRFLLSPSESMICLFLSSFDSLHFLCFALTFIFAQSFSSYTYTYKHFPNFILNNIRAK